MRKEYVSFYADPEDVGWLREYSKRTRIPMSVYFRDALEYVIKREKRRLKREAKQGQTETNPGSVQPDQDSSGHRSEGGSQ